MGKFYKEIIELLQWFEIRCEQLYQESQIDLQKYFSSQGVLLQIQYTIDCNQTTIWRNVKKYEEFGLDSLLQETRGGRNHAYMTVEEEKAFLARHLKAAEAGEFVTIDALFQAYKKECG